MPSVDITKMSGGEKKGGKGVFLFSGFLMLSIISSAKYTVNNFSIYSDLLL